MSSLPPFSGSWSSNSNSPDDTLDTVAMSARHIVSTTLNSTCSDVCSDVDVGCGGMAQLVSSTNAQQDMNVAMTMTSSSSSGAPPRELPAFCPAMTNSNTLLWSDVQNAVDGDSVCDSLNAAYCQIFHRRRNIFHVTFGKVGKGFVLKLTRLFRAFSEGAALESIALKAAMVLPTLVLQRPHSSSRSKEHIQCLEHHLHLWRLGQIDALIREGQTIQVYLKNRN